VEILKYEDLHHGGFAGLEERRFVTDERVFGRRKLAETTNGIGNFVYLADANFLPKGETGMHPHREIDVISVMAEGRVQHAGSLEHGTELNTGMVQVQRAGADGFTHNEINPDDVENRMIQLWVLPDEPGEPAGFRVYTPKPGQRLQVYGGDKNQDERFYSGTSIDIANVNSGDTLRHEGNIQTFIMTGSGEINGEPVSSRTLVKSDDLAFTANEDAQLILVYAN
jgi:redox-sensitive bicupin YhaK (pirin superfamily)